MDILNKVQRSHSLMDNKKKQQLNIPRTPSFVDRNTIAPPPGDTTITLPIQMLGVNDSSGLTKKWICSVEEFRKKNYKESVKILQDVATSPKLKFNLGILHRNLGDYDKAVFYFSEAIKLDSSMAITWFCRGCCFQLSSQFPKAVLDYTKTLELMKHNRIDHSENGLRFLLCRYQVLYNRAMSFVSLNLYHRARDDLLEAEKLTRSDGQKQLISNTLRDVTMQLADAPISSLIQKRKESLSPKLPRREEHNDTASAFLQSITNRPPRTVLLQKKILEEKEAQS